MSLARALAPSLSFMLLASACTLLGGSDEKWSADGTWRADDRTVALAHEEASSMGGHGLPGGIMVGIAEHARLEIQGEKARVWFTGERVIKGGDYAVVEPTRGELQLTVVTESRDLPTTMKLRCVSSKMDPCTSLRLVAHDDTVLADEPAITLSLAE